MRYLQDILDNPRYSELKDITSGMSKGCMLRIMNALLKSDVDDDIKILFFIHYESIAEQDEATDYIMD